MYLRKVEVENFRLLQNVTLNLEAKTEDRSEENPSRTTVIVGRNNSGKTSLTELFRRLLEDKQPSFILADFSLSTHDNFMKAYKLYQDMEKETDQKVKEEKKKDILNQLPSIKVRLTIQYGDYDYGPLSEFIIDLNDDCKETQIEISYQLHDDKINYFFSEIDNTDIPEKFYRTIDKRISECYKSSMKAVDPNDESNQKKLESLKPDKLFNGGFINAQRGIVDVTNKDINQLGSIFGAILKSVKSDPNDTKDKDMVRGLEIEIEKVEDTINSEFKERLKTIIPNFKLFGYPGLDDPNIITDTRLNVESLMKSNTKIIYDSIYGSNLPETYSGMGVRNLIFILLKLFEFFSKYKSSETVPCVNLIFIEEPEAHLHPQMQEVFINQLDKICDEFANKYNNKIPWPVQFIITTHSSHLANQASFESIRYFHTTKKPSITQIKDLRHGLSNPENNLEKDRGFLHKYMTLTRCDLYFADKTVLIEGITERLLLRKMIQMIESENFADSPLSSQYYSIVEVGGFYAHLFMNLLDFLELPALIITDIDSIKEENGELCQVSEGKYTANPTIKKWFDNNDITPEELIKKSTSEKILSNGIHCIAYQVPEESGGICGRSFEEAFILANPQLKLTKDETAYERAKKIRKKSDFALKYLIEENSWNVPRYIKEGLHWFVKVTRANLKLPPFSAESAQPKD
ncbi:MAG: AAA family ATPase [Candidatus Magnetominusculus sp. LBB02]|nr:AAA family ATPase [Candidatus Magnetominusculus sp. LBB02]